MLQSMESQRVRHDLVTEQQQNATKDKDNATKQLLESPALKIDT